MDPHGSTSKPDQPSTPQFNIESFSGYGSTASSLPGSGAVTPRTTVFVDPHYDERAPLLPDPHGDPAEAEAGSSGSKGEFSKRICVWDRFTISVGYVRSSSPTHCTFVAPVPSKHKQLYARSCCRKIYQTLGLRFFMRHSSPPPFKEGYRYFGMGSQIWVLSSNSLLAYCSRSPAGLSFCERIAGDRMSSGVSIGSVSSGRLGQLVGSW